MKWKVFNFFMMSFNDIRLPARTNTVKITFSEKIVNVEILLIM